MSSKPVRFRSAFATLALLLMLSPAPARAAFPYIVFPTEEGITLVAGQTYLIQWGSVHLDPVPIYLIKWVNDYTSSTVITIASVHPNFDYTGSYTWTVPCNLKSGSNYAIQAGVVGLSVAFSDYPFTITGGGSSCGKASIDVQADPPFGGTVSGAGTFDLGTQRQIAATAASCFVFTGWSDGNPNNPRTVTAAAGGATYTAEFTNVLADAVDPFVDANGYTMRATFIPQGQHPQGNAVMLSEAAASCGVDHWNWIQYIVHVPTHWTIARGPLGFGATVEPPLLDPIDTLLDIYKITSANSPGNYCLLNPWPGNEPWDAAPFYWNEAGERALHTHDGALFFSDSPGFASWMLDPAKEYVAFETRLAGVRADGTFKTFRGVGTNFRWKTNAILNGLGGVIEYGPFKIVDTASAPALSSGGVVSIDSPIDTVRLSMKLNFRSGYSDQAKLIASFELPPGFTAANASMVVVIGAVSVDFVTDEKGKGANGLSTLKLKTKNGVGSLTAKLKGDWDTNWAAAGLGNQTTKQAPVSVPVLLTFDTDPPLVFSGDVSMRYTATAQKSGTAK